jgi:CBS domain containing-hemolysin-like protein
VTRYELDEAYRTGQRDKPVSELVRPIQAVPEQSSVADALNLMLQKHEHILIVVDEYGGFEGIVTLEDAIETLLGLEIVDETDAATDMQDVARRLAKRRKKTGEQDKPHSD